MTYNTPSNAKKHHKSTEPESHQMAKMFFFLSFLFFFFRRASSELCDSFTMVFAQNSSVLHTFTYHPYLVSFFLLSLHLVSFLMFYNLVHCAMYAVCLVCKTQKHKV